MIKKSLASSFPSIWYPANFLLFLVNICIAGWLLNAENIISTHAIVIYRLNVIPIIAFAFRIVSNSTSFVGENLPAIIVLLRQESFVKNLAGFGSNWSEWEQSLYIFYFWFFIYLIARGSGIQVIIKSFN